jgi:uncharacterized alpha-E superfamily protein
MAVYDRILTELAALAGMGMENTTRGPAWRFLDLGRRIERSQHLVDLDARDANYADLVDVEKWRATDEPQRSERDSDDEDGSGHSAPPSQAFPAY